MAKKKETTERFEQNAISVFFLSKCHCILGFSRSSFTNEIRVFAWIGKRISNGCAFEITFFKKKSLMSLQSGGMSFVTSLSNQMK